jgi:ABC-type multidrug transport system ATPase subunit
VIHVTEAAPTGGLLILDKPTNGLDPPGIR